MPSFPPRNAPTKKLGQLEQRAEQLKITIDSNLTEGKLNKSAEKYRAAFLSLLKAKIHVIHENAYKNGELYAIEIEKLERQVVEWQTKTIEEIINTIKKDV